MTETLPQVQNNQNDTLLSSVKVFKMSGTGRSVFKNKRANTPLFNTLRNETDPYTNGLSRRAKSPFIERGQQDANMNLFKTQTITSANKLRDKVQYEEQYQNYSFYNFRSLSLKKNNQLNIHNRKPLEKKQENRDEHLTSFRTQNPVYNLLLVNQNEYAKNQELEKSLLKMKDQKLLKPKINKLTVTTPPKNLNYIINDYHLRQTNPGYSRGIDSIRGGRFFCK